MGVAFWIRRFFVVLVIAFVVIAAAQLMQGETAAYAMSHGMLWAVISAGVFIAARIYQSRRGQHCALCQDTPETRADGNGA